MGKPKTVRLKYPGKHARVYPPAVRAAVDYDYVSRLNTEEARYLSQFTDEYYGQDFRTLPGEEPLHATQALRRERYRATNAARRDIYTRVAFAGLMAPDPPDLEASGDPIPAPRYLDTDEYRAAREEFRVLVDVPTRKRTARQETRLAVLQDYLLSISEAED